MLKGIKNLFKAVHKANKAEIEEIKNLKLTKEDKEQGEQIAALVVAALAAYGIVIPVLAKPIIEKAIAYGLRDIKDGIDEPNKLIVCRIIEEMGKDP